jgi:hypothetical protein
MHLGGHVAEGDRIQADGPGRAAVFRMMSEALAPGGVVALKEFDSTTTRHGFFAEFDLVMLEELRAAFASLEIVRLEVVDTPVHEHAGDVAGSDAVWMAALLHARRRSPAASAYSRARCERGESLQAP